MSESSLERTFATQLYAAGLPEPDREYKFDSARRWRFDFAWPEYLLAVELEGGVWSNGRHTRGAGYTADLEKYNAAGLAGWLVLRFAAAQVQDGSALEQVEQAIARAKAGEL